jgi:hypothetical protein
VPEAKREEQGMGETTPGERLRFNGMSKSGDLDG